MSFGFRKSFSSGPLRFTLSKSGVSTSFGVRGARVTTGPRGTFVTVSSHGFYYRERLGQGGQRRRDSARAFTAEPHEGPVDSTPISDLIDSSSEKLLSDLNSRAQMFNPAILGWIGSVCLLFCSLTGVAPLVFIAAAIGLAVVSITLQVRHRQRIKTRLHYELDQQATVRFQAITSALKALWSCQKLWRVERREFTSDWKRNAGASRLNDRKRIAAGILTPPNVECNLEIPAINFGNIQLYFFPDRVLVMEGKRFGAVAYDDFKIEASITQFVEDDSVASDSRTVGYRWRYMNKDGGPDRRFNNNNQIPVVLYGELGLRSNSGFNILLQTSRPEAANEFKSNIEGPRQRTEYSQSNAKEERRSDHRQRKKSESTFSAPPVDDDVAAAYKLFGLTPPASRDEISSTYHRLAAMYHPDKVAHLAPEFRMLADERMKEINAAYAVLNSRVTAR